MHNSITNKKMVLVITIMMIIVFFTGCSNYSGIAIMQSGKSTTNSMSYSYKYLNGSRDVTLHLKKDITVGIDYDVTIKSGKVIMKLIDAEGNNIWKENFTNDDKDSVKIQIDKAGNYKVVVEGKKTEGSFEIKYYEL